MQKGQREYMLCNKCDRDLLGPYDKYGIEMIRDSKYVNKYIDKEKEIWTNIDYNKFKIFLLSVLLRAHFAEEKFTGINLNDDEVYCLKKHVLQETAPPVNDFPVLGVKLFDPISNDDKCDEIITHGNTYLRDNYLLSRLSVIIFGGYAWMYVLPSGEKDDINRPHFLKLEGVLILLKENIREFYPVQQLQNSINYSNNNFERIKKRK
jgi:hypothetical protein